MQTIKLELDVSQTLSATDKVAGILGGLNQVLEDLGIRLKSIMAGARIISFLGDAAQASKMLDKELLVMRLALGKLRVAWGQAFAPIAQLVLPMINSAIFAVTRFVRYVGKIIAGLFGFKTGSEEAADAQDGLTTATTSANRALKRTIANFDQLNRLNGNYGSSSTSTTLPDFSLNADQLAIVERIKALLEPLKNIDLQPLITALQNLWTAMQPITRELFSGLEWAWFNIFVPISQWTAEKLLPSFVETLAVAMEALGAVIEACKPALQYLWENFLLPLGKWAGEKILQGLQWLRERLDKVSAWMTENKVPVEDFLVIAGAIAAALVVLNTVMGALNIPFTLIIGLAALLASKFVDLEGLWEDMPQSAKDAWQKIKGVLQVIWAWVKEHVLTPVKNGMKSTVNGIIDYVNTFLKSVVDSINSVIRAINRLSFTVPDWVPGLGGKRFGFDLKQASYVKIPHLAQGAVLPANKPFLAMVGDQRHGTNVEAPLSTIQEAVGLVMEDMIASNLAGQESIVAVLRQILEAVLGIRIGDGDIARAVDRYKRSMAVVSGRF